MGTDIHIDANGVDVNNFVDIDLLMLVVHVDVDADVDTDEGCCTCGRKCRYRCT